MKRRISTLAAVLSVFLLFDRGLASRMPPYVISSGKFWLNDYELTRRAHPEEVWDKVFYGNSVVISAYREKPGGYINFGIDCGLVTDLWAMIRKGQVRIGSELVLGLNDLTLYDKFDTNPTYPWLRKTLEPYCYFERDRLRTCLEKDLIGRVLHGHGLEPVFLTQEKQTYSGSLSMEELQEKLNSESYAKYLSLPIEDFDRNFAALDSLTDYCREHGIRLRVVWMPRNTSLETPDSILQVYRRTMDFCQDRGVEFHDMRTALDASCFYDIGHLNNEYGAILFTEEIDPWLMS